MRTILRGHLDHPRPAKLKGRPARRTARSWYETGRTISSPGPFRWNVLPQPTATGSICSTHFLRHSGAGKGLAK
jgi:hypothetical protein